MEVGDFQVSVLGGVVLHAGIVAHLFGIFFHVVRFVMGNDALGIDLLSDIARQIN